MTSTRSQRSDQKPLRLPFGVNIAVVLLSGTAVAAAILFALWQILDRPRIPAQPDLTPKDLLDNVKLSLSVVAGIGGLVALVVAYRKQRIGEADHQRSEAAAQREDTKLLNERFRSSSDQLGSDKAAVRLAGVYAMRELADDWTAGRQMCIDVLCAYLRMPFSGPYRADSPEIVVPPGELPQLLDPTVDAGKEAGYQELQVRLAIHRVLHLRLTRQTAGDAGSAQWAGCSVDLSGAHLADIDFDDCEFEIFRAEGAVFHGSASFFGMHCAGVASLHGSAFLGDARFSYAVFEQNADFSGVQVAAGAYFNQATFTTEGEFHKARFFGAAEFQRVNGDLSFPGAAFGGRTIFSDAALAADSEAARFRAASLSAEAAVVGLDGPWRVDGRGFSLKPRDPGAPADE